MHLRMYSRNKFEHSPQNSTPSRLTPNGHFYPAYFHTHAHVRTRNPFRLTYFRKTPGGRGISYPEFFNGVELQHPRLGLSPTIPALTIRNPITPIIPALAQKGVGGFLFLTFNFQLPSPRIDLAVHNHGFRQPPCLAQRIR